MPRKKRAAPDEAADEDAAPCRRLATKTSAPTGGARGKAAPGAKPPPALSMRQLMSTTPCDEDTPLQRAAKMMLAKAGIKIIRQLHSNMMALKEKYGGIMLTTLFSGSEVQESLRLVNSCVFTVLAFSGSADSCRSPACPSNSCGWCSMRLGTQSLVNCF